MPYRQLAASGCATPPQSLGLVESVVSGADVSSVVAVVVPVELVSSVELVAGVATEFAELPSVPAAGVAVVVTGVAAVLCEVAARASPGMARAKTVASETMAGTIQPWIRFRSSEVMAIRSFDEGSIRDLHSGRFHLQTRVGNQRRSLSAAMQVP
jgi:hypothetical protein